LIEVDVPGQRIYRFENLILDLNGTITLDGKLIEGVKERIESLRNLINILIVTADTRGKAHELTDILKIPIHKVNKGNEQIQKLKLVRHLGLKATACVGNGSIDASMLKESILGICVVGPEGTSFEAIANCDIVVPNINAALDLFIKPERLIATLRK
jgi:soluble P-type ATPase